MRLKRHSYSPAGKPAFLPAFVISLLAVILTIILGVTTSRGALPMTIEEYFYVVEVFPPDGATQVSLYTPITVSFSLYLVPESVNEQTFQLLQNGSPVPGSISVDGYVAEFSPGGALPAVSQFEIRVKGGADGVLGYYDGEKNYEFPLLEDFTSSFLTGAAGGGTLITPSEGGTVEDPRTGAATDIPEYTLKVNAVIRVLTLDSQGLNRPIDNTCGVPIPKGGPLPDVPGYIQLTEAVRYEVEPCGTIAFGPSMRLRFPLRTGPGIPNLRVGTRVPFYELTLRNDRLVFEETGIIGTVTERERPGPFGPRTEVTVLDIPSFGTYAAFYPSRSAQAAQGFKAGTRQAGTRLYFPVVTQSNDRQTRINIANSDPTGTLGITLTAYQENGSLAGVPQGRTLGPGGHDSYVISELFPRLGRGSVIVESQNSAAMTGFSEIADDFRNPAILAGAEGIENLQRILVFPVVKSVSGGTTVIHGHNPDSSAVSIRVRGFSRTGSAVTPMDSRGQPAETVSVPAMGTLIISVPSSPGAALSFDGLGMDGGHVIVEALGGPGIAGGEILEDPVGGQMTLSILNGLPCPSGRPESGPTPCSCQGDESSGQCAPSSVRQYTLYATQFENDPANQMLYLVNVSDAPAELGLSVFSEGGQFRASYPAEGFMSLDPHQVMQVAVFDEFGFNPSPGYIRVEDQNWSLAGGILNLNSTRGQYETAVPLIADDPKVTPTATNAVISRIRLDPASTLQRQVTGLLVFNPNNNPVQFRVRVIDERGTERESPVQTLGARSTFLPTRLSLGALFPNFTTSAGFAQVALESPPSPGTAGRLIGVALYRTSSVVSAVRQQEK